MKNKMISDELQKSDFGSMLSALESDNLIKIDSVEKEGGLIQRVKGALITDDCDSENNGLLDVEMENKGDITTANLLNEGKVIDFRTKEPDELFKNVTEITITEKAFHVGNKAKHDNKDIQDRRNLYNSKLLTKQAQVQQITNVPSDYMKRLGG